MRKYVRSSWLGRMALMPWRLKNALTTTLPPIAKSFAWTVRSREHYNYSYDLQPLNLEYLAAFVAVATGEPIKLTRNYIGEINNDQALKDHVVRLNRSHEERWVADAEARFGRRMGWYALIRAQKPRLVVETGVDKGLGSCVIAAALLRNAAEGSPGRLLALDINPSAGYLLTKPYSQVGQMVYGDSLASIAALTEQVDFFIHDSDHSAEHESKELSAVEGKLSSRALVLSDNADCTGELLKFAERTGRQFLFFAEKPRNHWWPGDGIGLAFNK
ncbi:MAG TPA: class I SAM-dependent methyltransferase [Verrucomicrobiae bacterium]|nr:class I SAM-dependent methyltransferase [Verrucomicrobiae bacterium]